MATTAIREVTQVYAVLDSGAVVPIVVMEDEIIHTDERPTCDDLTCPCNDEFEAYQLECPQASPHLNHNLA